MGTFKYREGVGDVVCSLAPWHEAEGCHVQDCVQVDIFDHVYGTGDVARACGGCPEFEGIWPGGCVTVGQGLVLSGIVQVVRGEYGDESGSRVPVEGDAQVDAWGSLEELERVAGTDASCSAGAIDGRSMAEPECTSGCGSVVRGGGRGTEAAALREETSITVEEGSSLAVVVDVALGCF